MSESSLFPRAHSASALPVALPGALPGALRDLVAVLYRQAGLIAVGVLVGGAASAAWHLSQPRVYTASATVWVQAAAPAAPGHGRLESEIALMRTRASAQAVVDKYAIDDSQLLPGGLVRSRSPAATATATRDRAGTVDRFLDGLSVEPLRATPADAAPSGLEVRFDCTDPALAPRALQALLDNYRRLQAERDRRGAQDLSRLAETRLTQAREELGRAQDRIVALLVPTADGAVPAKVDAAALRLAASPDVAVATAGLPANAALEWPALPLRLDEAHEPDAQDAQAAPSPGPQPRPAGTARTNTPLQAELDRLELARQLAQARYAQQQGQLDQIDQVLIQEPPAAGRRVTIDADPRPGVAEGRPISSVALLGPAAGLLLGLLLAWRREHGGHRLRSLGEAEWALGVPVLGALPTLPAKAMTTHREPATRARGADPMQPE